MFIFNGVFIFFCRNKYSSFKALTNVLNPHLAPNKRGRGRLVRDFCESDLTPKKYFDSLQLEKYNPFNLLMVDLNQKEYFYFNSAEGQGFDYKSYLIFHLEKI